MVAEHVVMPVWGKGLPVRPGTHIKNYLLIGHGRGKVTMDGGRPDINRELKSALAVSQKAI